MADTRFEPPRPERPTVVRTRLLDIVRSRFDRRVTALVAGPGFGKTTLLAQALEESRAEPRGYDAWVSCLPEHSAATALGAAIGTAFDGPAPREEDATSVVSTIAAGIARRAPLPVAVVLDDVHVIAPESSGEEVLRALPGALPENGHLVLASRTALPIPLARMVALADAVRIDADALAFTDTELAEFARLRRVDVDRIGARHWPALAELAASADAPPDREFLWDELLGSMPVERRVALAALSHIGGADDTLLSAALERPVRVSDVVGELPLVSRDSEQYRLHALWEAPLAEELDESSRRTVCRRAAEAIRGSDPARAVRLLVVAEDWPATLRLITEVCSILYGPVSADVLGALESLLPAQLRESPEAQLLRSVHDKQRALAPSTALAPLERAASEFRARGDIAGELACLPHLFNIALWQGRRDLGVRIVERAIELESVDPAARVLAAIGRSLLADASGDPVRALGELDAIVDVPKSAEWEGYMAWQRAQILLGLGDTDGSIRVAHTVGECAGPLRAMIESVLSQAQWLAGDLDAAARRSVDAITAGAAGGTVQHIQAAHALAARFFAFLDRPGDAKEHSAALDELGAASTVQTRPRVALARAASAVAEGDERGAAAALEELTDSPAEVQAAMEPTLRRCLTLPYVLVPPLRELWDGAELGECYAVGRDLAAALVELRELGSLHRFKEIDVPSTDVARAWLPTPWAAELAAGLVAAGRMEGAALARSLPDAACWLERLASSKPEPLATAMRQLVTELPQRPTFHRTVNVLGPLELLRDGTVDELGDLRRERVRALLGYLVVHRRVGREVILAALWPDLTTDAAGNNLRVTLSYLVRALEPGRDARRPSFFVRQEAGGLEIVTDEHLTVDAWEMERLVEEGRRAENDGVLSRALERYRAAAALWRGELLAGVEAEWVTPERDRLRARYLEAALRAGEFALAAGDADTARRLAGDALAAEPWDERAFRLLAAVELHGGHVDEARGALDRCARMLDELGLTPQPETLILRRQADAPGDGSR